MKSKDVFSKFNKYSATVRVKVGGTNTTVNTVVFADTVNQARALLQAAYGEKSVVNVSKLN